MYGLLILPQDCLKIVLVDGEKWGPRASTRYQRIYKQGEINAKNYRG
jgi:hypothetical protein